MTIDEAIKILTRLAAYLKDGEDLDRADAIKLGIAALERITICREDGGTAWVPLLPGETKD